MADQWETVSRSSKRPNQKVQNSKNSVQKTDKRFEKALGNPDLAERTVFDALAPKERKEKVEKHVAEKPGNESAKPKSNIPRPVKKDTGSTSKKPSGKQKLEVVLKAVSYLNIIILHTDCMLISTS